MSSTPPIGPTDAGAGGARPGRDTLDALRSGRIQDPRERLRAASSLLEASFFQELFKAMRQTVPEGGLTSGGSGEEIFSSLLDQHLAEVSAMRNERGIGQALYRHFLGRERRTGGVEE